jgi:signal transduction protein with GAF and PtsI domain
MNPNQTADLAAGERPPLAPTAAVTQARYNAAETLMRRLRADPGSQLVGCSLHLYLPDDEQRLLVTALEHDLDRSRFGREGWAVGQGIVGRVWRDGDAIVARGVDIVTALGDLAEAYREPYEDLAVLVAVPIVNANDRTIGVLTAHADNQETRLDSPEGLAQLLALAEVLARVLVDLLGWATDLP